jgi:hypothetical protein
MKRKSSLWTMLLVFTSVMLIANGCAPGSSQPMSTQPEAASINAATQEPTNPPAITATEGVKHQSTPGELPSTKPVSLGDQDSSVTAAKKMSSDGDRFLKDWFERPFNANTMDTYYPYLDIVGMSILEDTNWVYVDIQLKNTDEAGHLPGRYGVELDLDQDGRGDWLILASAPVSTDWSVQGVQVWQDSNTDVGNAHPIQSDPPQQGNGYDQFVFDQGVGQDPDLAWSRISSQNPASVQIAFKQSLLGGDKFYLIGGWAGTDALNPAWFDLNDHFTYEEAGAADPGFELFYPIKELAQLDNTCRIAIGSIPAGNEPGLCQTIQLK